MTTSDQDVTDAVAARLRGHEPWRWFPPELARIPVMGMPWLVMTLDTSELRYFHTEELAWKFHRTGVMPSD